MPIISGHSGPEKPPKKTREWCNENLDFNGQAYADAFVLNCTSFKRNGFFLELGSRHPKENNNSYILEKSFGWRGVMVDRENTYEQEYISQRPNSIGIIKDATKINYKKVFEENNFPRELGFFQLDLEVRDNTALKTLLKIDQEVLNEHTFATITMEHDIYTGLENAIQTRSQSRNLLNARGYYCVFEDILDPPNVCVDYPYEDWWVHPDLVDMKYIKSLQEKNKDKSLMVNTKVGDVNCFKSYEMEY